MQFRSRMAGRTSVVVGHARSRNGGRQSYGNNRRPAAGVCLHPRPTGANQQAKGGNKADVDYIFDIPVELIENLTGYRHDRVMPELGNEPFEALYISEATPKRSWIRRLFGV